MRPPVCILLLVVVGCVLTTEASTVESRALKRKLRLERRATRQVIADKEARLAAARQQEREEKARAQGKSVADYTYVEAGDDNCTCVNADRVSFQGYSCNNEEIHSKLTHIVENECAGDDLCVKLPDPVTIAPTPAPTVCTHSLSFIEFGVADFSGGSVVNPPDTTNFVWPTSNSLPLNQWDVGPTGLEAATYYTNRENNIGLCNSVLPAEGNSFITFGSDRNEFFGDARKPVISVSFDVSNLIGSVAEWSFSYLTLESDVLEAALVFSDINGTELLSEGFTSPSGQSCSCGDSATTCAALQGAPLDSSAWFDFSSSQSVVPAGSETVTLTFSTQTIMSDQSFYVFLDSVQLFISCM